LTLLGGNGNAGVMGRGQGVGGANGNGAGIETTGGFTTTGGSSGSADQDPAGTLVAAESTPRKTQRRTQCMTAPAPPNE
jgi:hypothetical protein